jgi:hypothetical protein
LGPVALYPELAGKTGAGDCCAGGENVVEAEGDSIDDVADGAGDAVLRMLLNPAL